MNKLLSILLIGSSAFLVFSPSFLTSMHGDEWKVLWLARQALVIKSNYMPVNSWDTPYLFEHITLDLMSRVFPIYSGWFYFASFVIRMLAAYFVYKLSKRLTKSTMSGLVASFLFAISPVGVEAVIWVRNYSAYFSLIIFILVYIKEIYTKKINPLIILIGFILILIINTTRSHGFVLAFIVCLSPFLVNKNYAKKAFLSLFLVISTFILAATSPYFGGQAMGLLPEDFDIGMFFISLFGNIGRIFVSGPTYIKSTFLAAFTLFLVWKSYYLKSTTGLLMWIIFLTGGAASYFFGYTVMTEHYLSALFGVYFLAVLTISTVYELLKKKTDLHRTLLVFGLSVGFLLTPMIRQPQVHMGSDHRYLIHTALVIPLIASFAIKKHLKISLVAICVITYAFATQTFNLLEIHRHAHSSKYTKWVWAHLEKKLKRDYIADPNYKIHMYTDAENASRVNASVYFDFSYHAGLKFEVWDESVLPLDGRLFFRKEDRQNYLKTLDKENSYVLIDFTSY